MKEILLLGMTLGAFGFGFYIVKKFYDFFF